MYNNISYNKDYYTIEKLMNSRKQNSVVCENDTVCGKQKKDTEKLVIEKYSSRQWNWRK